MRSTLVASRAVDGPRPNHRVARRDAARQKRVADSGEGHAFEGDEARPSDGDAGRWHALRLPSRSRGPRCRRRGPVWRALCAVRRVRGRRLCGGCHRSGGHWKPRARSGRSDDEGGQSNEPACRRRRHALRASRRAPRLVTHVRDGERTTAHPIGQGGRARVPTAGAAVQEPAARDG